GIRPEDLSFGEPAGAFVTLRGKTILSVSEGARAQVELDVGGHRTTVFCDARYVPAEGRELVVHVETAHLRLFAADALGASIVWKGAGAAPGAAGAGPVSTPPPPQMNLPLTGETTASPAGPAAPEPAPGAESSEPKPAPDPSPQEKTVASAA